jgi:hypothetical protein
VLLVRSLCGIIYVTAGFCANAADSSAFVRHMWRNGGEVPTTEIVNAV